MIVSNQIRCWKCRDEIFSAHRHDFVTCSCGAVSVDGGCEYLRRVGNFSDIEEMSICMPKEVVDACIESWDEHGAGFKVLYELNSHGYDVKLKNTDIDAVSNAITWGLENNRNSRGIVYAIFRALRDSGVDLNGE